MSLYFSPHFKYVILPMLLLASWSWCWWQCCTVMECGWEWLNIVVTPFPFSPQSKTTRTNNTGHISVIGSMTIFRQGWLFHMSKWPLPKQGAVFLHVCFYLSLDGLCCNLHKHQGKTNSSLQDPFYIGLKCYNTGLCIFPQMLQHFVEAWIQQQGTLKKVETLDPWQSVPLRVCFLLLHLKAMLFWIHPHVLRIICLKAFIFFLCQIRKVI